MLKDHQLQLRLTKNQLDLIKVAAKEEGRTLSNFVLVAAIRRAEKSVAPEEVAVPDAQQVVETSKAGSKFGTNMQWI